MRGEQNIKQKTITITEVDIALLFIYDYFLLLVMWYVVSTATGHLTILQTRVLLMSSLLLWQALVSTVMKLGVP